MAYEGLKLQLAAEKGGAKIFTIGSGPYDFLSKAEKAWNEHVKASLAKGQSEGLTLQDYNDFQRQMREGKTPVSTSARSGKMTNSSSGMKRAGVQKTKSTGHPSSSSYTGAAFSQGDIDRAVARAVTAERERVATVFASDASFGRERVCADLLANSKGFSAGAIVAELPNLPRDSERGRRPAGSSEQSAAVWKKAIAANNPDVKAGEATKSSSTPKSVWDRAIANVYGKGA